MPAGGWASRRRARRSISRSSRARCRRPVPAPPAPSSVAATAGVRMGMRAARKVPIHDCRAALAGGRRTIFECAVSGNLGERPLHRDGAAQPCACTPVAQLRRAITSGWPRSAGSGCHNALRAAGCPGFALPFQTWYDQTPMLCWAAVRAASSSADMVQALARVKRNRKKSVMHILTRFCTRPGLRP